MEIRASSCSRRGGRPVPRRKRSSTDARTDGKRSPQAPGAEAKDDESSEATRGVYMISVAAELAGMHPQTLRIYEARGLITPQRSPKNTRLYSQDDVERLRRIQELTSELGMNLAGVERVFELEDEVERLRRRMRNLERHARQVQEQLEREIERVRRSYK